MTDAAALRALIDALESAPQGSRELDARLALATGWTCTDVGGDENWQSPTDHKGGFYILLMPPRLTQSLDAALPGEEIVQVGRFKTAAPAPPGWGRHYFAATHWGAELDFEAKAATEPLARRSAALRAMLHEMEKADG